MCSDSGFAYPLLEVCSKSVSLDPRVMCSEFSLGFVIAIVPMVLRFLKSVFTLAGA